MNEGQKSDNPEEAFLAELLASTEKDQDDQLYKKDFYVLEEEIANKKDQNSIKFKHDVLLKKLILDDYCQFPPKREQKDLTYEKKNSNDTGDAIDNEGEFLKEVQRINYLTFSPFGLKFFDNPVGSDNCLIEDEKKLHKLLNFDYEHFELNDDLVFNICQGYVDINKLSEDNITANQPEESSGPNTEKKTVLSDDEDIDLEKLNLFRENMKKMRESVTDGNYTLIEQEEEKVNQLILNSTKKQINTFLTVYYETFKEKEEEEMRRMREIEKEKERERERQIEAELRIREEEMRKKEEYIKNKELYLKKAKSNKSVTSVLASNPISKPNKQQAQGKQAKSTTSVNPKAKAKPILNDRTEWAKPKKDNYFNDYY